MRLVLLRIDCDTGRTCPNVNLSDRRTYVLQGYTVALETAAAAGANIPPGVRVVELPVSLLPELLEPLGYRPGFHLTGRGTVLAWGPELTDAEALAELAMPDGESAIEVPYEALPALVGSHG